MKVVFYFCSILWLLVFGGVLFAQNPAVPTDLKNIFDHTLDSMWTRLGNTSLSAAVQLPDGSIWTNSEGISSISIPAHPSQAYLIGSVTKTITSACILQLVDEGVLSLDDSLHTWLDTMTHINPNITIWQLLQHRSGLFDVLAHPDNQQVLLSNQSRRWTPEELLARFMLPPTGVPGGTWSYCNTNYFLLSMIIKKATGKPFYQVYRERFFTPLGLSSFSIPAFEPISVPVAHAWMDLDGNGTIEDAHNFYMGYMSLNSTAGAAGGYFSAASDLSRWTRSFMREDLVSASIMSKAKNTVIAPGQNLSYGLGIMKKTFLGQTGFGHGGDLVYSASSWYFPADDISISVLNNDQKFTSWTLIPTVTALLKKYRDWKATTSSAETTENTGFSARVFPNPFSDKLQIQIPGEMVHEIDYLTICDRLGTPIRTFRGPFDATFEVQHLQDLPKGVYLLSFFQQGKMLKTVKVVK